MATGTDGMRGMYVPLFGDFTIKGRAGGSTDIVTIEAVGSATGDYIVCRSSAATEAFIVEDDGKIVNTAGAEIACLLAAAKAVTVGTGLTVTAGDAIVTAGDVAITNGYFLRFTSWPTTVPLTGLTLGDVFLLKISDTIVSVCVTVDGSNTVRYLHTTSG